MNKLFLLFTGALAASQNNAIAGTNLCAKGIIEQIITGLDDDILANGSYANTDRANSVTLKINGVFYRLYRDTNLNDPQGGAILATALSAASTKSVVELYDQSGGATCDDWHEIIVHKK